MQSPSQACVLSEWWCFMYLLVYSSESVFPLCCITMLSFKGHRTSSCSSPSFYLLCFMWWGRHGANFDPSSPPESFHVVVLMIWQWKAQTFSTSFLSNRSLRDACTVHTERRSDGETKKQDYIKLLKNGSILVHSCTHTFLSMYNATCSRAHTHTHLSGNFYNTHRLLKGRVDGNHALPLTKWQREPDCVRCDRRVLWHGALVDCVAGSRDR